MRADTVMELVTKNGNPPVLVMDLDGTALGDTGNLSHGLIEALNRFISDGGILVVSTGRTLKNAVGVMDGVDLADVFFTTDNGCSVFEGPNDLLVDLPGVTFDDAMAAVDSMLSLRLSVNVFLDDNNVAPLRLLNLSQCAKNLLKYCGGERSRRIWGRKRMRDASRSARIKKIWGRAHGTMQPNAVSEIQSHLADSTAYFINDYGVIEVASKRSCKLAAVDYLSSHLGWNRQDVYVVGDDGNDVPSLRSFEHSFAVANATDEAMAAACFRVASNQDGGVLDVLTAIRHDCEHK